MPSNALTNSTKTALRVEEQLKLACQEEDKLRKCFLDLASNTASINEHLARYQTYCERIIFEDFDFAIKNRLEEVLWELYIGTHSWYREVFKKLEKKKTKHVVEQRKVTKRFLEYIKSGQVYYRNHISQLAANFGGIPEVEVIAKKISVLDFEDKYDDNISSELHSKVLNSCFSALIRLGDLSRWREQNRAEGKPNWSPAIGYYDLAATLRPESGIPHNQLAVIAAVSKTDSLRIVYHFYRSLTAKQPPPTAHSNLILEFRKILNPARISIQGLEGNDSEAHASELVECFVKLHAKCMSQPVPDDYEEARDKMIEKLTVGLKGRLLPNIFQKMVLVNLAAEYVMIGNPKGDQHEFYAVVDLNISTFTALLQLVIEELEHQQEHGATNSNTRKAVDRVTAVMHRVLPGIRHYSSWLLYSIESSISNLSQRQFPMGAKSNLQALWIAYTKALTAFMSSFTVSDLLDIEYLLEEDEDTIGFVPFRACKVQNRFIHDEKPKPYGHLVSRHHPTREMLARIKELLLDGLEIVNGEMAPIRFVRGGQSSRPSFVYDPPEPICPAPVFQADSSGDTRGSRRRSSVTSTSSSIQQMVMDLVEPDISVSARSFDLNFSSSSSPNLPPLSSGLVRVSTPPAHFFEDPNFDVDPFAVQTKELSVDLSSQEQMPDCVEETL